jgi:hypothetical protein
MMLELFAVTALCTFAYLVVSALHHTPHYHITTAKYLQPAQCLSLPYQDVQLGSIELCFSGSGSCTLHNAHATAQHSS